MVAVGTAESIVFDNDLCILHVRTHAGDSMLRNSDIGKLIWQRAEQNDTYAEVVERDRRCEWGDTAASGPHRNHHRAASDETAGGRRAAAGEATSTSDVESTNTAGCAPPTAGRVSTPLPTSAWRHSRSRCT